MKEVPRSDPRKLSTGKAIIYSLIPLIVLLVLSELGLRMWAYHFRTPYERFNYSTGRLELVPNLRYRQHGYEFLINSKGFVGPEFEEQKADGVFRIIALGDSCTFGNGFWKLAYPAKLEELLNDSASARKFEVINAGIEGYNSHYALGRLRNELVRYSPDMVLIYIGWNDLMKVDPSNLSSIGQYAWLARLMSESYLIKAYSKLMFYYVRPVLFQPSLVRQESDLHEFDGFVPRYYRENLDQMVNILKQRDVVPVLMTRPSVLRADMTHEDLRRQNVIFPYYPSSYGVGRLLNLHWVYNDVVRSVARETHVPLVDLDRIFEAAEKFALFDDTMHANAKGHELIAHSVFTKIGELQRNRSILLRPGF